MNRIRNRAREHFPSVLLTLLSIIQAIALEFLWDHVTHRPELFTATWGALLGWLQVAISLDVIILIWLTYVGLVMRFRWTPDYADTILPFIVGLVELTLIELIVPGRLGEWTLVLGLVAALATIVDFRFMRRARRDPDNQEFFDTVLPATWRDYLPQILSVLFAMLAGGWLIFSGDAGWFALATLIVALVAALHNAYWQAKYWRVSMGQSPQVDT